jgi:hypothetical protein
MGQYLCVQDYFVDFNGDGSVTISDIASSIGYWLRLPGRYVIQSINDTGLGNFFEVNINSCDNWVSIVFSFLIWISFFSLLTKLR